MRGNERVKMPSLQSSKEMGVDYVLDGSGLIKIPGLSSSTDLLAGMAFSARKARTGHVQPNALSLVNGKTVTQYGSPK
jgi:hypothetical protein